MGEQLPLEDGYFTMPTAPGERPRLIGSYSPQADTHFFPRRRRCPLTEGPVHDVELSPEGVLYSWTFVISPWMGKNKFSETVGGHGVGQIDLPEGVRVQSIIDGDMGDWEIGMRMGLELHPVMQDKEGNDLCTFRFAPIGADPGASANGGNDNKEQHA